MTALRVGLVVISHSAKLAEGLTDILRQMAPDVALIPAGGAADGGLGTDFDRIYDALGAAESGAGIVVLADLGSAYLAAHSAIEFLEESRRPRVHVSAAPLVEGAIAAAVGAQAGRSVDEVLADSLTAGDGSPAQPEEAPAELGQRAPVASGYSRRVVIINKDGLHARPAAEFARLAASFGTRVLVNGRDAKSLLLVMSLGLLPGMEADISTPDPDGRVAVDALADLVEAGFGE